MTFLQFWNELNTKIHIPKHATHTCSPEIDGVPSGGIQIPLSTSSGTHKASTLGIHLYGGMMFCLPQLLVIEVDEDPVNLPSLRQRC